MFVHPTHVIILLMLVTLGCVAWAVASSRRAKRIAGQASAGTTDTLGKRVAVLEKIVTDPGTRLEREIDSLKSDR